MSGIHVKFKISPEKFLADLTEAVYQVALKHGFKKSFVEVELDLWDSLREVIRKDMQVSPMCGSCSSGVCVEAERFEPWSEETHQFKMGEE